MTEKPTQDIQFEEPELKFVEPEIQEIGDFQKMTGADLFFGDFSP